ncbi:hypothetical protein GCM10010466_43240 [Planomonospora alba]|uniref:Lipid/polyisoprenoid-binding YceI-like domain-containing protein n=1 Tax=Planomonospora alba TaxID=161354 RepID=A0ABP6NIQ0_9ACTN
MAAPGLDPDPFTGTYTLDPAHTPIGFVARHAAVTKVRGAFDDFDGTVVFDAADPAATAVTGTIRAASVDTRDEHLRGNTRLGFEGSVTINRKDYGVTWNAALETGDFPVSDKIVLESEVSAIKNA